VSTYEDYADASGHYDSTRIAVGHEVILGHLAAGPVPLADIALLDAGCGTGNYAAALAPHVGSLALVDASEQMLALATAKLAATPGAPAVTARTGTLQGLPFDDGSFDAVITNQVLHHLESESEAGWPEHAEVFAEYARVLRPGGVLVVNTCSHEQVRHGYWAFSLIPIGTEELVRRYAPLGVLEDLARDNGLASAGRFVAVDATIQGDAYFDAAGPLSESWRRSDSTWSLSPPAEIDAMIATVTGLCERGELEAYLADHDARRLDIGQTTFVVFRRPPADTVPPSAS
jgi:ubiquinone/menaquinone biosynthesis C-methylase UbiE